jgi:hypothetical protein
MLLYNDVFVGWVENPLEKFDNFVHLVALLLLNINGSEKIKQGRGTALTTNKLEQG